MRPLRDNERKKMRHALGLDTGADRNSFVTYGRDTLWEELCAIGAASRHEFDAADKWIYRVTDAGRAALKQLRPVKHILLSGFHAGVLMSFLREFVLGCDHVDCATEPLKIYAPTFEVANDSAQKDHGWHVIPIVDDEVDGSPVVGFKHFCPAQVRKRI